MSSGAGLHNAARYYSIEQHRSWCEVYSKLTNQGRASDGYHYSEKALDTFPRYLVLDAILKDIETIDPESLSDFEGAKSLITLAGATAENQFTRNASGEIEKRAQDDERDAGGIADLA